MYRLQNSISPIGEIGQPTCVIRLEDNATIPFDTDNTDYQAYLKWLEEGNQPEAAE